MSAWCLIHCRPNWCLTNTASPCSCRATASACCSPRPDDRDRHTDWSEQIGQWTVGHTEMNTASPCSCIAIVDASCSLRPDDRVTNVNTLNSEHTHMNTGSPCSCIATADACCSPVPGEGAHRDVQNRRYGLNTRTRDKTRRRRWVSGQTEH